MGITNSKSERSTALKLCKQRKRFIKQAIDSRYALAAAHVSYVQSLRNIGIALRRYAEAEVLVETSLSASATEVDKTPSHCSYPSPSPSHLGGVSDSPVLNGSPLSPPKARVSYMRSGGGASAVTVRMSPMPTDAFVEDGEFTMPPPPPPLPEVGSSWDYFNPADESFRFLGQNGLNDDIDDVKMYGNFGNKGFDLSASKSETPANGNGKSAAEKSKQKGVDGEVKDTAMGDVNESVGTSAGKASVGQSSSKKKKSSLENDILSEREDPSEFITHRAKDFLSSIKDIDSRFFRASESGREVSRMLEANKIHVGYGEARGKEFLMKKGNALDNFEMKYGLIFSCVIHFHSVI